MKIDSRAGQMAIASDLFDAPKLIAAYCEDHPESLPATRKGIRPVKNRRWQKIEGLS